MFEIKFYKNNSPKNSLTKSLSAIGTLNGELREETSIISPVITVETNMAAVVNCDYMDIPQFGRKYFITDIRSISDNLYQISGHVDVLSTYATQIKNNTVILHRQEKTNNLYLNDDVFKIYQNPNIITKLFPTGFSGWSFVLAVAGR